MMKRVFLSIWACAALLLSCTKEVEQPVQPTLESGTYTLTVQASKGERPDTKALTFGEITSELMSEWAVDEEVKVYKGDTYLGSITAQSKGHSTTLSGIITGDIRKDDVLTLKFLSPDYASQDGTLSFIANHCDYAVASVTVTGVEGLSITTTSANFINQQAIVKFFLKDAEDPTKAVQARPLLVTVAEQIVISVSSFEARSELFVAIPAVSSKPIYLKATKDYDIYVLNKYDVSFETGKYYEVTARLNKAVEVSNETQLNSAISGGEHYILLGANILLSNRVSFTGSKTVTLDLSGHTLTRGLSAPAENGGVIYIDNTSTLTINDGSASGSGTITGGYTSGAGGGIYNSGTLTVNGGHITGNTGISRGGGIFNEVTGTATINGGVISDNATDYFGGGIFNGSTLTVTGGSITGNTAGTEGNGAGIWSYGTLKMEGVVNVTGNTLSGAANNVYLNGTQKITVTGSLAGSRIGVTAEQAGSFTTGFNIYGGGEDPTIVFSADNAGAVAISLDDTAEAQISSAFPAGTIYYIERSWDGSKVVSSVKTLNNKITYAAAPASDKDYKEITHVDDWFQLGGYNNDIHEYYVLRGPGNLNNTTLNLLGKNVHLILCDGAQLTLSGGILMYGDRNLYIHCQSYGVEMGRLVAQSGHGLKAAGIGSNDDGPEARIPGKLEIHGGDIYAQGLDNAAGIGGGNGQKGGEVIVYGGRVEAHGGESGAGIGGGNGGSGGEITVYDGYVLGIAGQDGAGIGGGEDRFGGTVNIHGGTVIGYGNYGNADSDAEGAGIGSGACLGEIAHSLYFNVTGGHVEGYGGVDAAGIGGGYYAGGGYCNISGGYVYAQGNGGASGLGAGKSSTIGPDATITGGTVIAKAGEGGGGRHRAIGIGYYITELMVVPGERNIGPGMMVWAGNTEDRYERIFSADKRADVCYDYSYARIEPCTHPDAYYTVTGAGISDTHTLHCEYCNISQTGPHVFDSDTQCTICGVSGSTIYTVSVYQPLANLNPLKTPSDDGRYDAPVQSMMSEGSVLILPQDPTDRLPAGMEFAGWLVSSPKASFVKEEGEVLLAPGAGYTINSNVSLVARYTLAPQREITLYHDDSGMGSNANINAISDNDTKYFYEVTISGRTFYRDGSVTTLCLPFELKSLDGTPLEGATLRTLQSASYDGTNKKLTLHFGGSFTSLEAGKPYLVKWDTPQETNIVNPVFRSVYFDKKDTDIKVDMTGDVSTGAWVRFLCNWSYLNYTFFNPFSLYFGEEQKLHYPVADQNNIIPAFTGDFFVNGVLADQCSAIEYTVD